jgi:hypothetical protein
MKFSRRDLTNSSQWAAYRQLEQIPDSIPNPNRRTNRLASCLNPVWRSLLTLLMDELVTEQRVEYLDRCWTLNELGEGDRVRSNSLQRFGKLID